MGICNQTANWGDEKFSSRLGSEAYGKPQGRAAQPAAIEYPAVTHAWAMRHAFSRKGGW